MNDRVAYTLKAKFHYASWFGASSELAPNMFGASSELASALEFGFKQQHYRRLAVAYIYARLIVTMLLC